MSYDETQPLKKVKRDLTSAWLGNADPLSF